MLLKILYLKFQEVVNMYRNLDGCKLNIFDNWAFFCVQEQPISGLPELLLPNSFCFLLYLRKQ